MSGKREWTAERHAAATARCDAATKGPWATYDGGWREHARAAVNPWRFMFVVVPLDGPPKYPGHVASKFVAELKDAQDAGALRAEADAAFIAAARVDLPDALREIERLTRERDAASFDLAASQKLQAMWAADVVDTSDELARRKAEIERLTRALASHKALLAAAETAGRDVPQAPNGQRTLTFDRAIQIGEKVHGLYPSEAAAVLLAEFGESAKADPPVRHARHDRHDRHCLIRDGVGCSHEPGCEVER